MSVSTIVGLEGKYYSVSVIGAVHSNSAHLFFIAHCDFFPIIFMVIGILVLSPSIDTFSSFVLSSVFAGRHTRSSYLIFIGSFLPHLHSYLVCFHSFISSYI